MARGPDLTKREEWRRRLREFDGGDWTVADFCGREGVSAAAFYQWRRKLAGKRGRSAPASGGTREGHRRTAERARRAKAAVSFLPIEITGPASVTAASHVEVHLAGGVRLWVPGDDHGAIRAVIEALRSAPVDDPREVRAC